MSKITASVDYDIIIQKHPELVGAIHRRSWEFIGQTNETTLAGLEDMWVKNLKANKEFWTKHRSVRQLLRTCKNKAIIGVGAGQSYNLNKDVLRRVHETMQEDCVIVASNHQLKPMLKEGIIPDYVILSDASDVVEEQLTEDIPSVNTALIVGLHCSPKVIKKWVKQGRDIYFYITENKTLKTAFQKMFHKNPNFHSTLQGGNVLNTLWTLTLRYLQSTAFIVTGNDLSYKLQDDVKKQRSGYYADGDYSTNLGTGRDEAGKQKKWFGFNLSKKLNGEGYNIKLDVVGTTGTLWVYKTWIESQIIANMYHKVAFHYFNCSEGGILGVMTKDEETTEALNNKDNWFMLDDICPRWHTTMLEDTVDKVKFARKQLA